MSDGSKYCAIKLDRLRLLLQGTDWRQFEAMVPALIGDMLDVRFTPATSGFQDGADAGTVGRTGRRLRIEAKRYSSNFDARDIIGGFHQAITRDPRLECWIAAATRDFPEQLANALEVEGMKAGVPVLTIGWDNNHAPLLAALCTQNAKIVGEYVGVEAGQLAFELGKDLEHVRGQLRRELGTWRIGFEQVRSLSHTEVARMWGSKRAALARFGQDIAGGDGRPLVHRAAVSAGLNRWWNGGVSIDAPAAVIGSGGFGKSWAAFGWAIEYSDALPIVLAIPSGAITPAAHVTVSGILTLLGRHLAIITGTADAAHWAARLDRILARPAEEGPAICLLLDGLNQNLSVPWVQVLRLLQDQPFSGRVRCIITTRPQHYESSLGRTRGLVEAAQRIDVERYDDEPGGELDMMLEAHGLGREDLHADLIEFARVPRLFGLVTRLRDRLSDAGRVTTHRLLWEYGRDALGERAGRSFSEADWRAWLARIAERERSGLRSYTLEALSETTARPDLANTDVAARLSDIVDGNLTVPGQNGNLQLSPSIVAHALGMTLLDELDQVAQGAIANIDAALNEWLDPISGLEERAELLRAATSIMAERDDIILPAISAAIVTAWLQTQNLPDSHRLEIRRLASGQVQPLLDTVESSGNGPQAAARALAIDALRSVPDDDPVAYGLIIATGVRWYSTVSRDVNGDREGFEQAEAARKRRLIERIGVDASGPIVVVGYSLHLEVNRSDHLTQAWIEIIDGRPLAGATEVLARGALAAAIRSRTGVREDLKWLCLLNKRDPEETAARLRILSTDVAGRAPEAGINPGLPRRFGALLLWLTGYEVDENAAFQRDSGIDRSYDYDRDYLSHPNDSLFALERRHAAMALEDRTLPLWRRLNRAEAFVVDPSFTLPQALVEDVREAVTAFDPSELDVSQYHTAHDHNFEQLEVAAARCAPDLLADFHRRKLAGYSDRPTTTLDPSSWCADEALLVANDAARAGCRSLRIRAGEDGLGKNSTALADLLLLEIANLPATDQIISFMDSGLDYVPMDYAEVMKPMGVDEIDALIERYELDTYERKRTLACLMSIAEAAALSDRAWRWFETHAFDLTYKARGCAFQMLWQCDPIRFGNTLLAAKWHWASEENELGQHYGSLALIASGTTQPFEELAPALLPSLLPHAVRTRGGAPAEALLAAAILDEIVMRPTLEVPDTGATLTVDAVRRRQHPMLLTISTSNSPNDSPLEMTPSDEERQERVMRAVDAAVARVNDARGAGAKLYLFSVNAEDLAPLVAACPLYVARWREGETERSRDFKRHVRLAEGFYLALCEALMTLNPDEGVKLWRALQKSMHTRYIGRAGVDERTLMLFRAPVTPQTLELRRDLIEHATDDEQLLNISLGAIAYDQAHWLTEMIYQDSRSDATWRRRRSRLLEGFATGATLPVPDTHLEGAYNTSDEERRAKARRRLSRDAAARHWWRDFARASNPEAALAAWTLFFHTADRRSLAWLSHEIWPEKSANDLDRLKVSHAILQRQKLAREAERKEQQIANNLFDRSISAHVSPWYRHDRASGND